jgi:hypothetical protein
VIRIGNRCCFNAIAVPADLLHVPFPRAFAKCIKFVKCDKFGASMFIWRQAREARTAQDECAIDDNSN